MALAKRARTESDTKEKLAVHITEAAQNFKFATLALRACHVTAAPSLVEFVRLREVVTDEANLYSTAVLPIAIMSLNKVKELMEYFQELPFDRLLEIAEEILQDARECTDLMYINRDLHTQVAAEFKKHDKEVIAVIETCEMEVKHQEEKMENLKASANKKTDWAIGLMFRPVIPLLAASAEGDMEEARVAKEEGEQAAQAALVIRDTLQVAITKYCDAMDACAEGFSVLARGIEVFKQRGDKFVDTQKAFHLMMQNKSNDILSAVEGFLLLSPSAKSDLLSLPKGSKPNYAQQWLAEKRGGHSFEERLKQANSSVN